MRRLLLGPRRRQGTVEQTAIRTIPTTARQTDDQPPPVWADRVDPPARQPVLDSAVECDVCVIGLGVAGLTAARHLATSGFDVVGIEAARIGDPATARDAGMVLAGIAGFHHDAIEALGRRRAVAVYRATLDEIERLRAAGHDEFMWTGSLRIASSAVERDDCARQYSVMRHDGLDVQHYCGDEGEGLLLPMDGVVQPARRLRRLAARADEAGARLFAHTQAQHVGERGVDAHGGEVRCRTVIIAVDGGLERAVPPLAAAVDTARAQMLATAPIRQVRRSRPVVTRWGHDYYRQLPDGRVVVGGRRDRGGQDELTDSAEPSDAIQHELDELLDEHFGVRAEVTHRWAATIGCTADRLPKIVRLGATTIAIGGYNGNANVLGPMLGRAAAELAMGHRDELVDLLQD